MKKVKRGISIFLCVAILLAFSIVANATMPTLYDFGTWAGSGDISVDLGLGYNSSLAKLYYNNWDTEIVASNYFSTKVDGGTLITLDEEYLKTLTNGNHTIWARFEEYKSGFPLGNNLNFNGEELIVRMDIDHNKFVGLTYGDEEVRVSNYSVVLAREYIIFKFSEEYLNDFIADEGKQFKAYFMVEDLAQLSLEIDPQEVSSETSTATSVETSEASAIATSEISSDSNSSKNITQTVATSTMIATSEKDHPKTGDKEITTLLFSLLFAGVVTVLTIYKNKKEMES